MNYPIFNEDGDIINESDGEYDEEYYGSIYNEHGNMIYEGEDEEHWDLGDPC